MARIDDILAQSGAEVQPEEKGLLRKAADIVAPTTAGLLTGEKDLNLRTGAGAALELGSMFIPGGAAVKGLATGARVLRAANVASKLEKGAMALKGMSAAKQGLLGGGLAGAGASLGEGGDVGDVATGAATGAAFGGAFGKGLSIAGSAIKNNTGINRVLNKLRPSVSNIPESEYARLEQTGRISERTLTKAPEYRFSDKEIATVARHEDLIDKDASKTVANIQNKLGEMDAEVGNFLIDNNNKYNPEDLNSFIREKLDSIVDVSVPEENVQKGGEKMITNFSKVIKNNDMYSLWQARKQFDNAIDKAFSGSPTLQKEMKIAFRNAVQDFIGQKTPNGQYAQMMGDMSSLYKVQDLAQITSKANKGLSGWQVWAKNNKLKAGALKTAGYGAVGALGFKTLSD